MSCDVPVGQSVLNAWEKSYLKRLPDDIRDELLATATTITIPQGSTTEWVARFLLIQRGLARVQAYSSDGRAVTVRYAGMGQVVGLPSTFSKVSPVGAEAVTECEVCYFDIPTVQRLTQTRLEMAGLLLHELTAIVFEVTELLTQNLFSSVSVRVSRHLLDLAIQSDEGLLVVADQHSIAEAVGSVREVVARSLRKLRDDGILVRRENGLLIVNPARLAELSRGQ